jgi:hypothetical protein
MSAGNRLNKLSRGAYDLICNRWVFLLSTVHVLVWAGTFVPAHMRAIHRTNTTRKSHRRIFVYNEPIRFVIYRNVLYELGLHQCHLLKPGPKEAPVNLLSDVGEFAYLELRIPGPEHIKTSKKFQLDIRHRSSACINLVGTPCWPPPLNSHG